MKILIVEDLQFKVDEMKKFLLEQIPSVEIEVRMSYHAGAEEILNNHQYYDLILLDMSMQNYEISDQDYGGDPINVAGMFILDQMYNNDIMNKVIVVTMYPYFGEGSVSLNDLHLGLKKEFPDNYLGHVFFNSADDQWKISLMELVQSNFKIHD